MLENFILIMLIVISGWLVQRGGFCMVAAVEELLNKKPKKLCMIITVALISGAILMLFQPPHDHSVIQGQFGLALCGATIFGFGATLNNGCFFGTLTQLCKGNSHMLFSLSGIMLASVLVPPFFKETLIQSTYPTSVFYSLLFFSLICLFLFQRQDKQGHHFIWLLIPGLTFGIINSSTSGWSLSQLILNIWYFLNTDSKFMPIQIFEFFAFLSGMFIFHITHRHFKWKKIQWRIAIRHFFAGIIMVIGTRMMGGGNDTLLFKTLPSAVPEVFALIIVLVCSILCSIIILRKIASHKASSQHS